MKKSMQQPVANSKPTGVAKSSPTYKRMADHREPLPADVIARCADTGSSHGFRTR